MLILTCDIFIQSRSTIVGAAERSSAASARTTRCPFRHRRSENASVMPATRSCYRGSRPTRPVTCLPVFLSACLPVCLSACLPVCLSACLPVCLSACLPVCLSACLPVCLSACLPVCLSACLPVCLSACLSPVTNLQDACDSCHKFTPRECLHF